MPEFCTCGAQLPPDARFCHKCGKPQRDEAIAALLAQEQALSPIRQAPPLPAAAAPAPLSFRNPIAVRVGLLAAGLVCVMMMIPGVNYAFIVWWLGAGYFSVWTYKRRTGQRLTVRGGARMGWITGVLSCGLLTLLFVFLMVAIQRSGGIGALKDGLHDFAIQQSKVDELIKVLQHPLEVLLNLVGTFIVLTLTCTAGGALGAKILSKD
jgi:hypothetical protein